MINFEIGAESMRFVKNFAVGNFDFSLSVDKKWLRMAIINVGGISAALTIWNPAVTKLPPVNGGTNTQDLPPCEQTKKP